MDKLIALAAVILDEAERFERWADFEPQDFNPKEVFQAHALRARALYDGLCNEVSNRTPKPSVPLLAPEPTLPPPGGRVPNPAPPPADLRSPVDGCTCKWGQGIRGWTLEAADRTCPAHGFPADEVEGRVFVENVELGRPEEP